MSDSLPLVAPLAAEIDPEQAFLRLAGRPHCVFFDSARRHPALGRYSFVAADPFDYLQVGADEPPSAGHGDALALLAERLRQFESPPIADLPPFQGGAAGLVSYDFGRQLERLPKPAIDEFRVPALAMGLYDVVVAFDHGLSQAWIISQGWPERDPARRRGRAQARLAEFQSWLDTPAVARPPVSAIADALPAADLAPQFATGRMPGLTSNFSREGYLEAVARAIEYVRAGDIFQVNLSQRLLYPAADDSISLYRRLRSRNPAPFAGYFDLGPVQIVSASPERFLRCVAGEVEARPIKGTRPRTALPEADLFSGDELRESAKDRAENVMIVDLLRNDLSRVCLPESVRVVDLCRLETYEFVQHLVSSIRGTLAPDRGPLDLLRAAFPGGSITGAPKIRAMEIIAELEPTARGAYCGSLAWLGYDGAFDSSILIRSITTAGGWWQAPVGGGIVAQSDPLAEYNETWHKAEGLLRALTD